MVVGVGAELVGHILRRLYIASINRSKEETYNRLRRRRLNPKILSCLFCFTYIHLHLHSLHLLHHIRLHLRNF